MQTVGVMMSYWVVYATNQNYDNRAAQQWRIPLAVQMIPSGLQFLLIYCIEESPRWLALKGKTPEALKALAHLRNKTQDDLDVLEELAEIQAQIEEENSKRSGLSFKECWEPANRTRFFIGAYLMIMQQWGGQNFINYCERKDSFWA